MAQGNKATLRPEERATFFRLFLPLLDYVNQAYEISEVLGEQIRKGHPDIRKLGKVAGVLWANVERIDDFIAAVQEQGEIDSEDQRLLESWKRPLTRKFVLERHLTRGSVFIDSKSEKVYLVKGLTDPWKELLWDVPIPCAIKATLLPFRDCIISDGLVAPYPISFGAGYREVFRQIYMKAKQEGTIKTAFSQETDNG